jgi:diguanylate cyclase (GGDEF)-like protein
MFSQWRYFNFSKESVESCLPAIAQYNARSLRIISMAAVILVALSSFFPLLIEKEPPKFILYLATAAVELGVYCYARRMQTRELKRGRVYTGFLVFFSCIMAFGIYIGILTRSGEHAVNFMVFLVCGQIIFVMNPLRAVAHNVVVVGVFSYLAIRLKPTDIWQTDVLNAVLAATAGMVFGWDRSRAVINEILTAQRLEEERNRFEAESIRDDLTGLSNHRDFFQRLDFYIAAAVHVRQTLCIIMMDVDHFKAYNDFYGHLKGDQVLKAIGGVLSRFMAEEKVFAARIGGEEFIVIWTENRLSEAERLTLHLRQMILDLHIPHETSPAAPGITASFGLFFLRGDSAQLASPIAAEGLYEQADKALYEAKRQGRNRIILLDSADNTFRQITHVDERTPPAG